MQNAYAERKIMWENIVFYTITMSLGLIGAPWFFWNYDTTTLDWVLFGFYTIATGLGITVGYHRLFSHRAFDAHPIIQFLLLFFGAAAFEESLIKWASQHRDHHKYVDTERDPYNIKQGFFHAHMGWILFWRQHVNYDNVKDLQKSKMIMHQHNHYGWWAIGAGVIFPLIIGYATGHFLATLFITVGLRIVLVCQATFCINSVCHYFGKATYDPNSTAKDHWLVALITFGEGYHNFHHRFPSDYRNAILWYQWDPSKWTIALLEKLGLANHLKRIDMERIEAAKAS